MGTDEYVPHESYVRHRYVSGVAEVHGTPEWEGGEEFDRFLARVRREAVEEYKNRQVQIHLNPAPAQMVPVPVRCPKCGHR